MKSFALSVKSATLSLTLISVLSTPLSLADRKWNDANDPRNIDSSYNFNFMQLPPHGDLTQGKRGWSDSYWPKTRGYIAERWQDARYAGPYKYQKYPLIDPRRITTMSSEELNLLSPAEKFDIIRGDISFKFTKELRKEDAKPNEWWKGLCNGWTQASINIDEPHSIVFKNPANNIAVPLTSGDVKGLMAYFYAKGLDQNGAKYIGKSCRAANKLLFGLDGACTDVHAASFHIALLNEIGLKKSALAIDRDPTVQVWNQAFVKYDMVIDRVEDRNISKKATKGTRKEVYVTTTAYYSNELYKIDPSELTEGKVREDLEDDYHVNPQVDPVLGTPHQEYGSKTYKYVLELDSRDQIIGGDWLNESDPTPDLIWKQTFSLPNQGANAGANGSWSILADIIQQATAAIVP